MRMANMISRNRTMTRSCDISNHTRIERRMYVCRLRFWCIVLNNLLFVKSNITISNYPGFVRNTISKGLLSS